MSFLLSLSLLLSIATASQTQAPPVNDPKVEVLSVACVKIAATVDLSDSFPSAFPDADNARANRQTTVSGQPIVSQAERDPRISVEKRSDRMGQVESNSGRDARNGRGVTYEYTAKVRNNGDKTVARIFWDYQSGDPSDQRNFSVRRFRCVGNIKPNGTKSLKAVSAAPPNRTIRADASEKNVPQKAVIGRLEFTDGSSWQLLGWELGASAKDESNSGRSCTELH